MNASKDLEQEQQKLEKKRIAQAMGQAIRMFREEKELSKYKACRLANIDPVVFQRYDTGKVSPGIYNLLKIAKGIDVHPAQILEKAVEILESDKKTK